MWQEKASVEARSECVLNEEGGCEWGVVEVVVVV